MRTMTWVPVLRLPRPMQAAVVAEGDDAGGVDSVVANPVVRRDLVSGGEGFGSGVEGLQGCSSGHGAVGAHGVVVGGEVVELVLQFGGGGRGWLGAEVFFQGLVEALDLAAGL